MGFTKIWKYIKHIRHITINLTLVFLLQSGQAKPSDLMWPPSIMSNKIVRVWIKPIPWPTTSDDKVPFLKALPKAVAADSPE